MKRLLLTLTLAALLVIGLVGTAFAAGPAAPAVPLVATGTLTQPEADALLRALDDEYHAWAVYDQVIKDFGSVNPFVNIKKAEENHIAAVKNLLTAYGVAIPANPWLGNVPHFDSLAAAYAGAIAAESANVTLYDTLKASTTKADLLRVYNSLQRASQQQHLPAFQRAAGSTTTTPGTGGFGRGGRSR